MEEVSIAMTSDPSSPRFPSPPIEGPFTVGRVQECTVMTGFACSHENG